MNESLGATQPGELLARAIDAYEELCSLAALQAVHTAELFTTDDDDPDESPVKDAAWDVGEALYNRARLLFGKIDGYELACIDGHFRDLRISKYVPTTNSSIVLSARPGQDGTIIKTKYAANHGAEHAAGAEPAETIMPSSPMLHESVALDLATARIGHVVALLFLEAQVGEPNLRVN